MNTVELLKNEERQPCERWTRVMGYFRPISQFNIGKKGEAEERVYFSEEKAIAVRSMHKDEVVAA